MKTETKHFFMKVIAGCLILGLICFLMFFFVKGVRAEDNKTDTTRRVLTEWTTQLVYDTANACYQGTVRWIVMLNPTLLNQNPNPLVARQMMIHCFCVLDKIQHDVPIEVYQKKVFDESWTGELFMTKALECVKKEKTLPSFFTDPVIIVPEVKTDDNETKKVIPGESGDSKKELPSPKPEESEDDSTTIFQG